METIDSLLTVGEVAAALRIHPRTVLRLIDKGDIGAILVSPSGAQRRRYRISVKDLQDYVMEIGRYDANA